jgi:hypothetical protein
MIAGPNLRAFTRSPTHLQVAIAWGWLEAEDVAPALKSIDRELGLLWGLTH